MGRIVQGLATSDEKQLDAGIQRGKRSEVFFLLGGGLSFASFFSTWNVIREKEAPSRCFFRQATLQRWLATTKAGKKKAFTPAAADLHRRGLIILPIRHAVHAQRWWRSGLGGPVITCGNKSSH